MHDERIDQGRRHVAASGFFIWYILLLGILMYRQFHLAQSWSEYWDIAVAFLVGTLYVTIATFARGAVVETSVVRAVKWTALSILVAIVAVLYLQGRLTTVVDLLAIVTSALVSLSMLGLISYLLYRRWEKRSGLEK